MVADQREPTAIGHLINAFLGVAAVTDDIAQAECFVNVRTVAQDRLQRLPVGVDVRQDRDFQTGFS
jgi:hypothetical protein